MATKTTYHHGNLKEALITAALRELAHEGIAGFSLRNVARRAGVSAPAVYRHFADKDDLLAAVAAECADRIAATTLEAVATAPTDPLERFRSIGIAFVRFAVRNPEHFRVLSLPGLVERTPPERHAAELAWKQNEKRALAEAQAHGQIADVPLDDLLLAADCVVRGLAHAIVEGRLGDVDEERATDLAVAVTGVLGLGLIPRADAPCDPRPRKKR